MYPDDFINKVIHGDCMDILKNIPDNTIDTIITDPPYELNFMSKSWDNSGISFDPQTWKEVLRVVKPGGFILCFGGSRTYHRIACAIEDAGWELRDCMMWIYGSGFPKSLNLSKAIDKKYGAEREVVGYLRAGKTALGQGSGWNSHNNTTRPEITIPSTELAKKWDGWETALKPAYEPIIVAMKPVENNFAYNAEKWGVAGLNIQDCRIPLNTEDSNGKGRWPSNIILDEESSIILDEQTGSLKSGSNCVRTKDGSFLEHGGNGRAGDVQTTYGDSGGASRFFYCAKACKSEKGQDNKHTTVKPLKLMEYLCRLTKTPSGGVVLDPFLGSGSTAIACIKEGRDFIGIEKEKDYFELSKKRIEETFSNQETDLFKE